MIHIERCERDWPSLASVIRSLSDRLQKHEGFIQLKLSLISTSANKHKWNRNEIKTSGIIRSLSDYERARSRNRWLWMHIRCEMIEQIGLPDTLIRREGLAYNDWPSWLWMHGRWRLISPPARSRMRASSSGGKKLSKREQHIFDNAELDALVTNVGSWRWLWTRQHIADNREQTIERADLCAHRGSHMDKWRKK